MNEKKTLLLARTTSIKKLEESGSADRISYRYQMLLAFADCVVGAQLLNAWIGVLQDSKIFEDFKTLGSTLLSAVKC
jgi:hypothetical protein